MPVLWLKAGTPGWTAPPDTTQADLDRAALQRRTPMTAERIEQIARQLSEMVRLREPYADLVGELLHEVERLRDERGA